jgi:hypothetical protein
MPKGGRRAGAGRKPGTKSKRTREIEAAGAAVVAKIGEILPDAFEGDGVALLQVVYRDPSHPLALRLDAAYKAARYERPALAATLVKGELADVTRLPPADRKRRIAELLAAQGR